MSEHDVRTGVRHRYALFLRMHFLKVTGISRTEGESLALKEVSFELQQHQNIAIVGETGSGKSTLLKIIGGLVQPSSGTVHFKGNRVEGPLEKLIPGHPGIAYLSQHFELRNNYRVEEILEYANKLTEAEARTIHNICRITHLLKRKTDQVSGGERQRIALAKLLVSNPKLLLLDEPFSNLDLIHKNILQSVIQAISDKLGLTCILVSHDPTDTLSWANEIKVMKDGEIIQSGTPEQVYHQPVNEYTAALFGKFNLLAPASAADIAYVAGLSLNGKSLFFRPEKINIVQGNHQAINGRVRKSFFKGGYYELEVKLSDVIIHVRTASSNYKTGEEIYLTLEAKDISFIG